MKISKLLVRALAVLALAVAVALQSGCVAVAVGAGAGAVAYIRGDLEATLEGSLNATNKAADRAVSQLEFVKISDRKDALAANLTARTAQDKKVEIIMTKVSGQVTKVKIRVGIFGDEAVSLAILDKIRANL
jgi:hypothetical protein